MNKQLLFGCFAALTASVASAAEMPRSVVVAGCGFTNALVRTGESAFQAGRAFCRMMCPKPRLPKEPFYGYNDWYCAYGKNTATNFLLDAAFVSKSAEGLTNRPYVVMDDGWQLNNPMEMARSFGGYDSGMGPWDQAGPRFGMDMKTFCGKIAALGTLPCVGFQARQDRLPDL